MRIAARPIVRAHYYVLTALLVSQGCSGCSKDAGAVPAAAPEPLSPTTLPGEHAEPVANGPRVVFLGDSISAGLHLPASAAFPAVLARRLATAGHPFTLVNAGVSGDTTSGGLRRVDWLLRQRPQIVVIELGGNDGLRGVELAHIEANLRAIIDKVRKAGATPLLLGMRLPPNYGADYVSAFDDLYPRLSRELDLAFVPFFMKDVAGDPDMNLEDGLHPTEAGHERLATRIQPVLQTLVVRSSSQN